MRKHMQRYLAMILTFAMVFTMFPSTLARAEEGTAADFGQSREALAPALHYDMSHADGKLTDVSGNGLDGALKSITDADFTEENGNAILNFDGSAKYVEIPAGVLKDGSTEAFTIEATYTDTVKSTAWLFTLGTTVAEWPNVKNYLFVAPFVADGVYNDKMLAAIKDGSTEMRYPSSKVLGGDNTGGENIVTLVFDNGNVTYYLNGEASEVTESGFKIQDILSANSTESCIGYIGKSLYAPDANFKGTVSDFKIYRQALTAEQVADIHADVAHQQFIKSVERKLLAAMLNGNASTEEVTSDLSFPSSIDGVALAWKSSDTSVVDGTGKIAYTGEGIADVTVTVTGTYNNEQIINQSYALKVTNADALEKAAFQALSIPNADDIRGNITLPVAGSNGSVIEWTSSNASVIRPTADGDKPAGVVSRPAADTPVTLTATLKQAAGEVKRTFQVTVKAKAEVGAMTDYVFAYFVGNGANEEQIFLATSRDGLDWEELNNGNSVLHSELGTKGLRDPFIIRSPEGDKFYMIATDLCIAADGNWTTAQTAGSQAIMVWESEDLIHWTEQRMVTVSAGIEAGCTWAPEIFYDENTGEYMVFWASKVKSDNYSKQRLYYCKTRDFYTFTAPQVWIDEASHSAIDSTVVRDTDGTYYRFTKNESKTFVYQETSDSLLGTWKGVGWTDPANKKSIAGGVEGPCCFKFNDDDIENAGGATWCLLLDAFGSGGYYPMGTTDLSSGDFTRINNANLPARPRHGTVMNITADEYNALMEAYNAKALIEEKIPNATVPGYELPEKVQVTVNGSQIEVSIAWDNVPSDAFANPGNVTVAGTIVAPGQSFDAMQIYKTITVMDISPNWIYYIDCGIGSFNAEKSTSTRFDLAKSVLPGLRNEVPDKYYSQGSWGIVNPNDENDGIKNSSEDSIYGTGWYAKEYKECEYIIPLEAGNYKATGYFAEWWSQTRPMYFYIKYTTDSGEEKVLNGKTFTIQGSDRVEQTLDFAIEGVADTTEVHFMVRNATSAQTKPDPVIAGLAIEKDEPRVEVESITLNKNALALKVGESDTLTASVAPANATDKTVAWSSDNTEVATVDNNGKVTAVKAGSATITAAAGGKSVTCAVTVTQPVVAVEVESVTLSKDSLSLTVGKSSTLTAAVLPSNASNKALTWKSSNEKVATVVNGKVTAKAQGSANIIAQAANGKYGLCKVTVKAASIAVKKVKLNSTKITLGVRESFTLKATVSPSNATNKKVTWKSSKEKVVKVKNGKITALKAGSATITATSGGKKATCKVTVKKAPTSIRLNKSSKTLKKGKTFQIKVTMKPKSSASYHITYKSNNTKVAKVSSKGKITAVKKGKATITVKAFNKKSAKIKITVK